MIENKNAVGKPADDFIRIQDLGSMFVPRWRWFALSLAVALSAAALYLLRTPAIYTRHAAILVKDDSKGGATSGSMGEFADFGLFKSNTNINNELLTLASPTLMTEVVKRLVLDETYTVRRGLRRVELYRSAPVAVRFCGKAERPVAFDLELTSRNDFLLSGFKVEGEETGETFSGKTGDTLRTSVGTLLIDATPYATDDFMGTSIHYGKQSVQAVTDYYTGALRAELGNEDATIINLSIDDSSVRKAEDILNTLIEVYNEYWIRDKNQIAVSTSQFIGDRLGVIENELGHVDANIAGYKSEHLLPDVQAASSLYLMQSAENKKELLALNNQLSTARYIRGELNGKGLTQLLPANSDIGNSHIESLIGEYNAQVLERNRLAANSSEKNPLVVDLTASLRNLHHTVVQSVDNLIVSLDTQLQSVRRREAATTGQLASNPDQARYLLSVERQQKVKEQLYLYLLQKREENELSQAFTAYNTRIITAPRGSLLPTAPRKFNILLAAFAVGLLLPAVLIFMKENMNTKVRGRKDLEGVTVPFIGEIPLFVRRQKKWFGKAPETNTIVVKEGSRDIINEAFRVLRTNLEFMTDKGGRSNVIVFTSFNPGSGKSFLAMNISVSLAIKGKKVLVVDGDLRHASASAYIGSPKVGLSDYLNGRVAHLDNIIVKDPERKLPDVLPVGTIPPNPTELLFDERLRQVIDTVRMQYDYVLIDCPPVELVADTQIIEQLADRTVFVVRAGLLERSMLAELENIYSEKKYKNMSMILNATIGGGGRYGYSYGYRYGYHYGYGYRYGSN